MEITARTAAVPPASIRELASLEAVHRMAWSLRPDRRDPIPAVATSVVRLAGRRASAAQALRRLAADPAATPAERALAAHRADLLEGCVA